MLYLIHKELPRNFNDCKSLYTSQILSNIIYLQLFSSSTETRKGMLTSVPDTYTFLPLQMLVDGTRHNDIRNAVSSTINIDSLAPGEACTTKVEQEWILHDRGQTPHME